MGKVYIGKFFKFKKFGDNVLIKLEKIISPLYCRRLKFVDASTTAYYIVRKDIRRELYSSDQKRVFENMRMYNINKKLILNPLFVGGYIFPTFFLDLLGFFVKYKKENDGMEGKDLQIYNSSIFYIKKQIKYTQYYLTGYKGYLK